jgi:hypothetical protein
VLNEDLWSLVLEFVLSTLRGWARCQQVCKVFQNCAMRPQRLDRYELSLDRYELSIRNIQKGPGYRLHHYRNIRLGYKLLKWAK